MTRLFRAHEVAATRAYAVLRVAGILTVMWATAAGLYICFGGIGRLTNPIFVPLVEAFGGHHVIGGILAAGGIVGLAGLIFQIRWLSILSCVLCAAWSGAVTAFLIIAAANGFDNLAAWLAAFCCVIYMLRFFLLVEVPDPDEAMHLE